MLRVNKYRSVKLRFKINYKKNDVVGDQTNDHYNFPLGGSKTEGKVSNFHDVIHYVAYVKPR